VAEKPATPCENCRYLEIPATGTSERLGTISATLNSDGSIAYSTDSKGHGCGRSYAKLPAGTIERHSLPTARLIEGCEGPMEDHVPSNNPVLRFIGLGKKAVTECGCLYDADLVKIVEDAVLHSKPVTEGEY